MKTANIWTIIVVALLCANCALLVLMWHQNRQLSPGSPSHIEVKDFIIKELALNAKQISQFDSLRSMHRKIVDSLNDENHRLKDQLFGNLGSPETNGTFTIAITQHIGNNSALVDQATFDHFKMLRSLLNTGQQNKFDAIIKQVLHMMSRQGPPPGPRRPGDMQSGPPPGDPGDMRPGPPPGHAPNN